MDHLPRVFAVHVYPGGSVISPECFLQRQMEPGFLLQTAEDAKEPSILFYLQAYEGMGITSGCVSLNKLRDK
jgi:hypothetical protein